MYCPSPKKYENAGRYIDIRMSAVNFKDHIQEYSLDTSNTEKIGPACYFEKKSPNKVIVKNDYVDYEIDDYDKIYISWATNLLPDEINTEDRLLKRDNKIYYCGTVSQNGVCENMSNFTPFMRACASNDIEFIVNNPWSNPLPTTEMMRLMKKSYLGIDIRGPQHLKQGLLTCRVFKNISYGHLGLTNSLSMYEALDGNCVYNPNTNELFYDGVRNKENFSLILSGMQYVKEHHTYINRINSILSVIS
jgi:hypothetical protein